MLAIVFNLLKIKNNAETKMLNKEDYFTLYSAAENKLKEYKIYTLNDRGPLFEVNSASNMSLDEFSSNDTKMIDLVKEINRRFNFLANIDSEYASKSLEEFDKNLDWDISFTFALLSCKRQALSIKFWHLFSSSYWQSKTSNSVYFYPGDNRSFPRVYS